MGDHVVKAHAPPSIAIVFFADSLEERIAPDMVDDGALG
jgi:hypothetical protein